MMPTIPMVKISDGRVMSRNGTKIPSLNSTYYFDQLIDHTNPGLGIFKQRYWHTWEWYEPGMVCFLLFYSSLYMTYV